MKTYSIPEWSEVVNRGQRKWKAKLEEMDDAKWVKQVLLWQPIGFRKQGRPAKRWIAPEEDEDEMSRFETNEVRCLVDAWIREIEEGVRGLGIF